MQTDTLYSATTHAAEPRIEGLELLRCPKCGHPLCEASGVQSLKKRCKKCGKWVVLVRKAVDRVNKILT